MDHFNRHCSQRFCSFWKLRMTRENSVKTNLSRVLPYLHLKMKGKFREIELIKNFVEFEDVIKIP